MTEPAGRPGPSRRPQAVFDAGLQQERTALAWERTAIATIVAGTILGRYAGEDAHPLIAAVGLVQVVAGAGLLVWAGFHYDELHGPLRAGDRVVHPRATRWVGRAAVFFTGAALLLAVLVTLVDAT